VIWDDLPGSFESEQLRVAAELALELEKTTPSLSVLADSLKLERDVPHEVALLLASDGLACDLWLTDGDSRKRWGPLGPFMEFREQGIYPPPLDSFPDALLPYFELRASTTSRPDLGARYHDLIGLRWKKFDHLVEAHRNYLEAGKDKGLGDSTAEGVAVTYLLRAADLSVTHKIEEDATIDHLREAVLHGIHSDNAQSAWIAERAATLIARRPTIARELIEVIDSEARNRAEHRRGRERALLEAAEELARSVKDSDRARRLRVAQAESLEAEAKERASDGGIIELALLSDASRIYQQVGAGADVQRLKAALAAASEHAGEEMHLVQSRIDIPQSSIDDAATDMTKRLGEGELLPLGAADVLGLWPTPERLNDDLNQAKAQHAMQFLVRHISIKGDGRFQSDPDDDAERHEAQLTRQMAQQTAFRLAFGESILDVLRHRGLWSAERQFQALRLVDEELAEACAPGLEALEVGRYWIAAHALIPQVERAVRLVAKSVGIAPMKTAHRSGLRWASLDEMLANAAVVDALGSGLAMSLRRIFIDPYGPNYRNEFAHGAADLSESQAATARLAALATLSVALRLAIVVREGASDPTAV
jgi:Domain of unknown function (DUF4209)